MRKREAHHATPRALTIAGSDSGGGAGIQADLKTFAALGVYGMSAITAVTAQDTRRVTAVQDISLDVIAAQIDAVVDDIGVDAVKVGMLSSSAILRLVAERVMRHDLPNLVVDPVMVATSGDRLLRDDAVASLRDELIPRATVVTPNLREAEVLIGAAVESLDDMKAAAAQIRALGPASVLVKGGHFEGGAFEGALAGKMVDVLCDADGFTLYIDDVVDTTSTHGTGCTLSSAIAAGLARGAAVPDAIAHARAYLTEALRTAFPIGGGHGPVNHLHGWWAGGGADGRGGASHDVHREPG